MKYDASTIQYAKEIASDVGRLTLNNVLYCNIYVQTGIIYEIEEALIADFNIRVRMFTRILETGGDISWLLESDKE